MRVFRDAARSAQKTTILLLTNTRLSLSTLWKFLHKELCFRADIIQHVHCSRRTFGEYHLLMNGCVKIQNCRGVTSAPKSVFAALYGKSYKKRLFPT